MPGAPPTISLRLLLSVTIAVASGLFAAAMASRDAAVPDLMYPLTAARFFLDGRNPYDAIPGVKGAAPPFDEPFFYPLTTVIALTPLATLPTWLAVGIFFGLSAGLLAFAITREELWRLHIFASAPFVVAASIAQFSPLLTFAALVPWAGALCTLKPNLGLAVLARQPSRAAIMSCGAFGLLSLAISPTWMLDWLHNLRGESGSGAVHEIPLRNVGGFLLLLAFLAWRRPAGRLLAALSILPQALFFYDQLPLWLVVENRKQSVALTASSQAGMLVWWLLADSGDPVIRSAYPMVMGFVYLPALAIVLWNAKRAPDQGSDARSPTPASDQTVVI